jgi:ElaB/YqjD/DUF883 family membrane-anchored ribosome-binding protein
MKTQHATADEMRASAGRVVEEAEELMSATADIANQKVVEARKRLASALERGKDAWNYVQDRAVAGARVADQTIREHPYESIGVAFSIGALVGFLLSRRS